MSNSDILLILIAILVIVDNFRIRVQFYRALESNKIKNILYLKSVFEHFSNVLFEAEVLDLEEMDFDGTEDELIEKAFNHLIGGVHDGPIRDD